MNNRESLVENEWFIVRHSGELPEITLFSSIHHLTDDPEGPGLTLSSDEAATLQQAALERSYEIVLRDMLPENRDKTIYRGLKRSIYNWQRLKSFAGRQNLDYITFRERAAVTLLSFLQVEADDVDANRRTTCLNCSWDEVLEFADELGVEQNSLPEKFI